MPKPKAIGEYRHYDYCRFCGSSKIASVINLGYMPLAGGFILSENAATEIKKEKLFPLNIHFCRACYLLHVVDVIDKKKLFTHYFYESSAITTLVQHFQEIATTIRQETNNDNPFVVEVGANDGAFVRAVQDQKIKVVGVDPARNIVSKAQQAGLPIELGYFAPQIARSLVKKYGQADAIYSFNTLAHIEDMHAVAEAVKILLSPTGYLTFEIHYLGSVVDELQYDMIYHEHQYYYSLLTLQKFFDLHDMEVWRARIVPTHAGSLQVSVQKKSAGQRPIDVSVYELIKQEKKKKYDNFTTFKKLGAKIEDTKKKLLETLTRFKKQGKKIAGYGASGRGTIISNYCDLSQQYLDYVIDDAPAKIGVITPGVHQKVYSSKILESKDRPDYVVLFAWSFLNEIRARNKNYLSSGGKFILPLPEVKVTT